MLHVSNDSTNTVRISYYNISALIPLFSDVQNRILDSEYVCVQREQLFVTYLVSPWSRVLLEKLTGSAPSQEIPRIFGTRRFLTVLTSARHLSLS